MNHMGNTKSMSGMSDKSMPGMDMDN
jgi:hypothetical protein